MGEVLNLERNSLAEGIVVDPLFVSRVEASEDVLVVYSSFQEVDLQESGLVPRLHDTKIPENALRQVPLVC